MLDPRKVPLLHLFLCVLLFGLAVPSTMSAATTAAAKSGVAIVVSRDQVTCTMCAECDNPCQPMPSPPPPSPPPPPVECPPPPSPPPPSPPDVKCPPPPMPPACSACTSPATSAGGGGPCGSYPVQPPPNPIVPYFPYYYYNPPLDSAASNLLHLETNAVVFATSIVLRGLLYVLHF